MNERMDEWTCEIFTHFFLLSQLARIQTDSVAEKLKELYPDIHLEIGENKPFLYLNIITVISFRNRLGYL